MQNKVFGRYEQGSPFHYGLVPTSLVRMQYFLRSEEGGYSKVDLVLFNLSLKKHPIRQKWVESV